MSFGKNVIIKKYTWLIALKVEDSPELVIGDRSSVGDFNHISAAKSVVLGKNVLTANRVYISDHDHGFEDINKPIMDQPVKIKSSVYIGDGSWIGENVSIMGAKIGKNCVVGANSVVTKDIPDFSVAVGVPAKVIKRYNEHLKKWEKV